MTRLRHLVGGTLVSTAIIAAAAVLSAWPSVRTLPPDTAMITVSLSHGGARNCRPLTDEELAKLPPNMRRKEICDRRRLPVYLELDIDGETVLARSLPPGGIAGDGASRILERFTVHAGEHRIAVRLRDSARATGFDHDARWTVSIAPERSHAIDFRSEAGGFVFH